MAGNDDDLKIQRLERELKRARETKRRKNNAVKLLERNQEEMAKAVARYQEQYAALLHEFGWSPATATRKGLKSPETAYKECRPGREHASGRADTRSAQGELDEAMTDGPHPAPTQPPAPTSSYPE